MELCAPTPIYSRRVDMTCSSVLRGSRAALCALGRHWHP